MAGPSVGHIEVTVDADTGRLKAQIVRAGKEAGEAGGEAIERGLSDVDGRELIAKLRKIKVQAERALAGVEIDVELDEGQARADLRALQAQLRAAQLEVFLKPEMDETARARVIADFAALRAIIEQELKVDFDPETGKALEKTFDPSEFREIAVLVNEAINEAFGDVDVSINIEEREAIAKAKAAAAAINAENLEFRMGIDLSEVNRGLRRMSVEAEAQRVDIKFGADMREINRALARMEAEHLKASVQFEADLTQINLNLKRFREQQEMDAIQLELETAKASAELNAFFVRHGAKDLNVEVEVQTARATAAFNAWLALQSAKGIDVDTDLDVIQRTLGFNQWLDSIQQAGQQGGSVFGKGFQSGAGSSFAGGHPLLAGIGVALVELIQPLSVAIEGLFSAAVAVVSSGMSALIGTVGAAIPLFAGLATTVGAGVIAFQGLSEAMQGDEEALAALTPAARDFAQAFIGLKPAFDEIKASVQERVFEGLGDELDRLAEVALPGIQEGLEDAAEGLNEFFRGLADVMAGIDFEGLFAALQPAVDTLLDAVVSLASAIAPFLVAAAPAAQQLAQYLADGAQGLADMVGSAEGAEKITTFLVEGIDSLRSWGDLVGELSDALITLFNAGREAGDGFIDSIASTIDRFDAWMESVEGQDALAEFFERGKEVIEDLAPLVEGLIGFFDRIVTEDAIRRFGEITDIIGDLLPALGSLFEVIGDALDGVLPVIGLLADGIALLAAAWEKLPEPIRDWIPVMMAGLTGVKLLSEAVKFLVDKLEDLGEAFDIDPPTWLRVLVPGVNLLDFALEQAAGSAEDLNGATKVFGGANAGDDYLRMAETLSVLAFATQLAKGAQEVLAEEQKEQIRISKEQRKKVEDLAEAMSDWAINVFEAEHALLNLSSAFEQMSIRGDALTDVFALKNAPMDLAGQVRDIDIAINDLSDSLKGIKVGDVLAGSIKADKFLDAIDAIRPDIQTKITEAFSTGGPEAATAMANEYIDKVTEELGGKFTREQVATMLGLDNIEATIAVAFELSAIENARRQLEVLVGIGGETPLTASIALALDAGTIDPVAALAIIQSELAEEGVVVPSELAVPTDPGIVAAAEASLHPAKVQTELVPIDQTAADTIAMFGPAIPQAIEVPATLNTAAFDAGAEALQVVLNDINTTIVDPTIEVDTAQQQADIDRVLDGLVAIDQENPDAVISLPAIDTRISEVDRLADAIDALHNKTVTITVNQVTTGLPGGALGGVMPRGGGWGAEAGPELFHTPGGTFGIARSAMIFPAGTELTPIPGNRNAALDALIATMQGASPVSRQQTIINQYFTLTNADPYAVSVQAMNRAAAAALI